MSQRNYLDNIVGSHVDLQSNIGQKQPHSYSILTPKAVVALKSASQVLERG